MKFVKNISVKVTILKGEEAFDTKGLTMFAQKFFKDKHVSGDIVDGITRLKYFKIPKDYFKNLDFKLEIPDDWEPLEEE